MQYFSPRDFHLNAGEAKADGGHARLLTSALREDRFQQQTSWETAVYGGSDAPDVVVPTLSPPLTVAAALRGTFVATAVAAFRTVA